MFSWDARAWACGATQALDLTLPTVAPAGAKSFNLVLAPGALAPGSVYVLELTVNTTNPTGSGVAQVTFRTNTVCALVPRKRSRQRG